MTIRTRATAPDLNAVLRSLYGALSEDVSFNHCLEIVGEALRCHLSGLHYEDFDAQESRLEVVGSVGRDELVSLASDYAAQWQCQNSWLQRGIANLISQGYNDGDTVVTGTELLSMPYFQHFLRRVDVRHGLGICLWHNGPRKLIVATFNRPPAEGPFTPETMAFVAALQPHLVNAFAIYKRSAQLNETNRSLREAMDRAPMGMLVLDAEGHVLEANEAAERLLTSRAGIARAGGGDLLFERSTDKQRFMKLLHELKDEASRTLNHSMLVMRSAPFAAPSLVLHLCAVPPRTSVVPAPRIITFLCKLTRSDFERFDAAILQTTLGLTRAELHVLVQLHHHYDLKAAAEALHVAPSTVRTHLKHAFEKTNTHKQAELLAIVERVLTLAPTDGKILQD